MMDSTEDAKILCLASQGHDHLDAVRLQYLLEPLQAEPYAFDHSHRLRSAIGLVRTAAARRPRLIVMEGTGLAAGIALLAIDALLGVPFVISSGDAVGPYLALRARAAGVIGGVYERALCRRCAGYVGWTPYLVGRALTFGAPRAMSAPGWGDGRPSNGAREAVRERLAIAPGALVVGLTGSLNWRPRLDYAYGAELIRAVRRLERRDVVVCILGDGPGLEHLQELAGAELGGRVLLPGRVPRAEIADHLAAFDIASLPQSVDRVGAFRYSTKLSEYLAAGLPVITGQIPAAYDLDTGNIRRLPGDAPWSAEYLDALVELLGTLSADELAAQREASAPGQCEAFDPVAQQRRVCDFIGDILAARGR